MAGAHTFTALCGWQVACPAGGRRAVLYVMYTVAVREGLQRPLCVRLSGRALQHAQPQPVCYHSRACVGLPFCPSGVLHCYTATLLQACIATAQARLCPDGHAGIALSVPHTPL